MIIDILKMNKYKDALKRLKENDYLIYDNCLKDIVLLEKSLEVNIEQEIDINGEPYAVGIIEFRFCDCHDKIEIVDEKLIQLFQKFIY